MKFSGLFVGALATLAAAAPAPKEDKRSFTAGGFNQFNTGLQFGTGFDIAGVNNFGFQNLQLAYLAGFNGFRNDIFSQLIINQNLAFDPFVDLFGFVGGQNANFLQLDHILGLQSALVLSWLGNNGLINGVNFAGGAIPLIDFGSLGGFISPLSQFQLGVDQVVTTQITSFVQDTGLFAGNFGTFGFKE
ncbi:uncharacterized protein DNG_02939 [Cephalotrichum gorgonifer]|uniref:Uncharacterized protein n=1 Tax=Cephalotrichum gorgonifer TaxID=2041049 RepID=A0AAE8STI2_9PEZI|nr:uncharacterized protein DNG_02939 [Cephalotrichum gorgonifer]